MGFKHPPKLFLRNDSDNSSKFLGRTAHYDPEALSVTLFIHNRHPKDILRSFAHELVHHTQNLRGDLSSEKVGEMSKNYAQDNDHLRDMEKEAYLQGNMCFRDWEDTIKDKDLILIKLAEQKFLKENKQMTVKIDKQFLKGLITKLLEEREVEEIVSEESTCAKGCDCEKCNEEESLEEGGDPYHAGMTSADAPMSVPADDCPEGKKIFKDHEEKGCQSVDWNPATASEGKIMNPEDWKKLKLSTTEGEEALYEARFAGRDNRLFEKLVKDWTK